MLLIGLLGAGHVHLTRAIFGAVHALGQRFVQHLDDQAGLPTAWQIW